MLPIAQVCINITTNSIDKPFSYQIPENLDYIGVGWRVLVPFGPRKMEGFVVEISEGDSLDLKPILEALDDEPWFNENMIQTALWLSEYYLCTVAEAMRLFIPGKSGIKTDKYYAINQDSSKDKLLLLLEARSKEYADIWNFIQENGSQSFSSLHKMFGPCTEKVLHEFVTKAFITKTACATKRLTSKYKCIAKLNVTPEEATAFATELKGKKAQQRLLSALLTNNMLTQEDLRRLNINKSVIQKLVEQKIIITERVQVFRDSYQSTECAASIATVTLNSSQQEALQKIKTAIEQKTYQSFLLHGVTGSGKTQVYIEAVAAVRCQNRQAIVIVPEIALTGQTVRRFKAYFGNDVVVIHSKLSVGERYDAWQRLHNEDAGIVIGARSAVFAPVQNLGIIILDEEHEFTYKQEEAPRYHTRTVAMTRARLDQAAVLLGSATPSIETYYEALQGTHMLLSMPERVDQAILPKVTLVDMREELAQGRRHVISKPLQELLLATLAKNEQAIILLNRRGYATFVNCRECGHVMRCRHCSTSLVYHAKENRLRCHYCQKSEPVPDVCPVCQSRYIRYFGTGTQKLEAELTNLLPGATIARMDRDTTSGKHSYDKILNDFAKGKYNILLGTQMVAKGHDISNVTAVGIISVDTVLNLPDFRAAERAFSLLTQAAGRAGRGNKEGHVVVQVYTPEHYALKAGAHHDYVSFYNQEIIWRKELNYPPFTQLVKITIQSNNEGRARRLSEELAATLQQQMADAETQIIGPFNAAIYKVKDIFRIHVLIKTVRLNQVRKVIKDFDFFSKKEVIIDIDPIQMM